MKTPGTQQLCCIDWYSFQCSVCFLTYILLSYSASLKLLSISISIPYGLTLDLWIPLLYIVFCVTNVNNYIVLC